MHRYIDADLIPYVASENGTLDDYAYRYDINEIPTADVVEVVRCKDCKYWQDNNGGYPHEWCRWRCDETPDADDFCACGERME